MKSLERRRSGAMPRAAKQAVGIFFDGLIRYGDGVRIQERLVAERQADRIPDVVLFLEHAPVITLGRRGNRAFLLRPEQELRSMGFDVERASRGGDVTYHGPGQLVMYPILRLGASEADARGYLWNLEEVAILTAKAFGVSAYRREGKNGAWTDLGKIAAIGFHLRRWVTMHGMSFNVKGDLAGFRHIIGCGLVGERVSSLAESLGGEGPSVADVRGKMARVFEDVMHRTLTLFSPAEAPAPIRSLLASDGSDSSGAG